MNNECYGDFFTADGMRYYRCFWDGLVIPEFYQTTCLECKRPIRAKEHGEVETGTVKFVILKGGIYGDDGSRVELP